MVHGLAALRRLPTFVRTHPQSVAYLIVAVALLVYAYRLETLAQNTNEILKTDLMEAEYVINEQSVPAAVYYAQRVQALTGEQPQLLFGPEYPPFAPPKP